MQHITRTPVCISMTADAQPRQCGKLGSHKGARRSGSTRMRLERPSCAMLSSASSKPCCGKKRCCQRRYISSRRRRSLACADKLEG